MLQSNTHFSESLLVHFRRAEVLREEALDYLTFDLNFRQLCDLELLLNRGYYPLMGYFGREEYEHVLENMSLKDGTVWPIPITLDIDNKRAEKISVGDKIALNDQEGFLLAILTVTDLWQPDKTQEAKLVYGTSDAKAHPGLPICTMKPATGMWAGRLKVSAARFIMTSSISGYHLRRLCAASL